MALPSVIGNRDVSHLVPLVIWPRSRNSAVQVGVGVSFDSIGGIL